MNTILITGTCKRVEKTKTFYDVFIWASREGEQIQLIKPLEVTNNGYIDLWKEVKKVAVKYFDNNKMDDGAYTQFLDHITYKFN